MQEYGTVTAQIVTSAAQIPIPGATRTITREEFESVIRESIERSVHIVKSCLDTYHIDIATVSGIAPAVLLSRIRRGTWDQPSC